MYIGVIAITALSWSSCGKDSACFKGSGNEITELRSITAEVTEIVIEDKIDLFIIPGAEAQLKLEGGENLLPYIHTDVSGNELKITSDNKCGFFRDYNMPLTAYLTLPDIKKITSKGQGKIFSSRTLTYPDLQFEFFNATGNVILDVQANAVSVVQHTGPTDVQLTGTVSSLYVYSGGNGWFDLSRFEASFVHVNHAGTGNISVRADSTLLVEMSSLGNLDYYGDPVVTVSSHTGSGKLTGK